MKIIPQKQFVIWIVLAIIGLGCNNVIGSESNFSREAAIDYAALKEEILKEQSKLANQYKSANPSGKAALVTKSRTYVCETIATKIFPAWLGTTWDFNGTTQVPRQGEIACGYFVTTVLRDAGFKIQRVKLAQQASLKIIQTLVPKAEMRDYGNVSVPQVCQKLDAMPEGLYIVGLDIHTGFIYNRRGNIEFVHASYGNPAVVVREKAHKSAVLAQSKRFVLGRVDNDFLLDKWLGKVDVVMN